MDISKAFSTRDLFSCKALIQQFVAVGLTDASAILVALDNTIRETKLQARVASNKTDPNRRKNSRLERTKIKQILSDTNVPKCPNCGNYLLSLPVNDSPSTQVEGDYDMVKMCRNCHYEEWK